jgi:hydrogenase expression/formation protein HypC
MCLAVPGRVLEITAEQDLLFGKVEFGGISKQICLELVPDIKVGEFVIVHVGFALARIEEAEAQRVLKLLDEMSVSDEMNVLDEANGLRT